MRVLLLLALTACSARQQRGIETAAEITPCLIQAALDAYRCVTRAIPPSEEDIDASPEAE